MSRTGFECLQGRPCARKRFKVCNSISITSTKSWPGPVRADLLNIQQNLQMWLQHELKITSTVDNSPVKDLSKIYLASPHVILICESNQSQNCKIPFWTVHSVAINYWCVPVCTHIWSGRFIIAQVCFVLSQCHSLILQTHVAQEELKAT